MKLPVMVSLAAALMLPLGAAAQTAAPSPQLAVAAEADSDGSTRTLLIVAGVISGIVVADLLSGGTLTAPILTAVGLRAAPPVVAAAPISPAMLEARAAGVVLGEQITAATAARDAAARRDLAKLGALALGAIGGGWLISYVTE